MPIKKEIELSLLNIHDSCKNWDFGNKILYDMCRDYPLHNDKDIIVGKIWLIGRSYAAAIERRKTNETFNGDFYYNVVAPKLLECSEEFDKKIAKLQNNKTPTKENVMDILITHKYLTDIFHSITGMEKRSLASKYLHFHIPQIFYIYDSRVNMAIRKYVNLNKDFRSKLNNDFIDTEYGDFFVRMLDIQEYAIKTFNLELSPRDIDTFLLTKFI